MRNLLSIALLLFSFCAMAQQEEEDYPVLLPQTYFPSTAEAPVCTSTAVVRFTNFAVAYLELSTTSQLETTLTVVKNNSSTITTPVGNFTTLHHAVLLENLELDQSYTVLAENSEGESTVIGKFTTQSDEPNTPISVSDQMFSDLGDYAANFSQMNLYDYVQQLNAVGYFQKLSFIQKYFFKGSSFSPNLANHLFPPKPTENTSACNCELVIRAVKQLSPGLRKPTINDNGNYDPAIDNSFKQDWNSKSKFWTASAMKGPAKYLQLWSQGRKISGKTVKWSSIDQSNVNAPNYAEISYNWLCTNQSGFPSENCNCSKEVELTYRYDTRLNTDATLPTCFLCGNKGTAIAVEDHSVLVAFDKFGNREVLDRGMALTSTNCSVDWNPDFLVNYLGIAGEIAKGVAVIESSDPAVQAKLLPQIVDNLVTQLQKIVKTPIRNVAACAATQISPTLMDGKRVKVLQANKPLYLRLYSFSAMNMYGYTSWINTGRILSDFNLAGSIYGGIPDNQPAHCCSDAMASWTNATVPDAPKNSSELMAELAGFFFLHNQGFDHTEYGHSSKKICPNPLQGSAVDREAKVVKIGQRIQVEDVQMANNSEYVMYNEVGQVVQAGKVQDAGISLSSDQTLTSGLYYILFVKDKDKAVAKFMIQQ